MEGEVREEYGFAVAESAEGAGAEVSGAEVSGTEVSGPEASGPEASGPDGSGAENSEVEEDDEELYEPGEEIEEEEEDWVSSSEPSELNFSAEIAAEDQEEELVLWKSGGGEQGTVVDEIPEAGVKVLSLGSSGGIKLQFLNCDRDEMGVAAFSRDGRRLAVTGPGQPLVFMFEEALSWGVKLALCMGTHFRLGAESWILRLDPHLLSVIWDFIPFEPARSLLDKEFGIQDWKLSQEIISEHQPGTLALCYGPNRTRLFIDLDLEHVHLGAINCQLLEDATSWQASAQSRLKIATLDLNSLADSQYPRVSEFAKYPSPFMNTALDVRKGPNHIAFSRAGDWLAVTTPQGFLSLVRIWSETEAKMGSFFGSQTSTRAYGGTHSDRFCVSWSWNGKMLATCGRYFGDGPEGYHQCKLWSAPALMPLQIPVKVEGLWMQMLALHPLSPIAAAIFSDRSVRIYSTSDWIPLDDLEQAPQIPKSCRDVQFSPDGHFLLVQTVDMVIGFQLHCSSTRRVGNFGIREYANGCTVFDLGSQGPWEPESCCLSESKRFAICNLGDAPSMSVASTPAGCTVAMPTLSFEVGERENKFWGGSIKKVVGEEISILPFPFTKGRPNPWTQD